MSDLDHSGTEFPDGIGRVAKRELAANGFVRYDQLITVSRRRLLSIHGIGPRAVRILGEELSRRGMSLADD